MPADPGPPPVDPGAKSRATTNNTTSHHQEADGSFDSSRRPVRQCSATPLRRRRLASQRMAPLDCGCHDPLGCRCTQPPLSDRWITAGRDAARHILATGHVPLLKIEILQALYRRGGDDRALAEQLHAAAGGQVT
jgi:hypothetical protein